MWPDSLDYVFFILQPNEKAFMNEVRGMPGAGAVSPEPPKATGSLPAGSEAGALVVYNGAGGAEPALAGSGELGMPLGPPGGLLLPPGGVGMPGWELAAGGMPFLPGLGLPSVTTPGAPMSREEFERMQVRQCCTFCTALSMNCGNVLRFILWWYARLLLLCIALSFRKRQEGCKNCENIVQSGSDMGCIFQCRCVCMYKTIPHVNLSQCHLRKHLSCRKPGHLGLRWGIEGDGEYYFMYHYFLWVHSSHIETDWKGASPG